jgi:hypothetical protein
MPPPRIRVQVGVATRSSHHLYIWPFHQVRVGIYHRVCWTGDTAWRQTDSIQTGRRHRASTWLWLSRSSPSIGHPAAKALLQMHRPLTGCMLHIHKILYTTRWSQRAAVGANICVQPSKRAEKRTNTRQPYINPAPSTPLLVLATTKPCSCANDGMAFGRADRQNMLFTPVVQTPVEKRALVDALQLTVGANGILPSCHQHARVLVLRSGSRAGLSGTHPSRTLLYM